METLAPAFTPADRCDRCGSQAHLRALLETGVLQFCGHHARMYHAALAEIAFDLEADS